MPLVIAAAQSGKSIRSKAHKGPLDVGMILLSLMEVEPAQPPHCTNRGAARFSSVHDDVSTACGKFKLSLEPMLRDLRISVCVGNPEFFSRPLPYQLCWDAGVSRSFHPSNGYTDRIHTFTPGQRCTSSRELSVVLSEAMVIDTGICGLRLAKYCEAAVSASNIIGSSLASTRAGTRTAIRPLGPLVSVP